MTSTNLMRRPVLILNASYEALTISSAKRAMKLLVKGVAFAEEEHDIVVHGDYKLPSVIRLKYFVHVPVRVQEVTRKNIFMRDRNTCQYCYRTFATNKLTLDHVMPRSRGGKNTSRNLVTACQPCNLVKADRTPEEAGMELLHTPRDLNIHATRDIMRHMGAEDPKWRRFLWFESDTGINSWTA